VKCAPLEAQAKDGVLRVFHHSPTRLRQSTACHGEYVRKQIAKLGRNHPLIKRNASVKK
jgi:hypothetical protein